MNNNIFKLVSQNANGLASYERCSKFASTTLYPQFTDAPDVVCLQETHFTKDDEKDILVQWQIDMAFAHNSSTTGGLAIAFRRKLDYEVHAYESHLDQNCHCPLVHCTIQGIEVVIANVYLHPNCSNEFFKENLLQLTSWIENFACLTWIVCGDFNSILDVNKDVQILDQRRCAKAQSLGDFASYNELSDIYLVLNPTSRRMTFFHKMVNTGARLDYIFVSGFFLNQVRNASISARTTSDHNPIDVQIDSGRNARGRGYWKLPEPLLEVEKFTDHIKGKIQDEFKKAVSVLPMVRWDMVKACVRRESIRYVKWDGIADKIKNEEFQAKITNLYFLRDTSPSIESGAIYALIEKHQ